VEKKEKALSAEDRAEYTDNAGFLERKETPKAALGLERDAAEGTCASE
jgi:hypothetical protein